MLPHGTSAQQRPGKKGKSTATGQGRTGHAMAAWGCCGDWLWWLHHVDAHRRLGVVGCSLTWLSRFRLRINMDGGADGSTSRDHPFFRWPSQNRCLNPIVTRVSSRQRYGLRATREARGQPDSRALPACFLFDTTPTLRELASFASLWAS